MVTILLYFIVTAVIHVAFVLASAFTVRKNLSFWAIVVLSVTAILVGWYRVPIIVGLALQKMLL